MKKIVMLLAVLVICQEVAVASPKWTEKDGVIYFTVTSNGWTCNEWIIHFQSKKIGISNQAKLLFLLSKSHKNFTSKRGTAYSIAVIKGDIFSDENRTVSKIWKEADKHKFVEPNAEVAFLIRDQFTDDEIEKMGVYNIMAMFESIPNKVVGDPGLMSALVIGSESCLLAQGIVSPDDGCLRESGFAFLVSQASYKN